MTHHFLSFNELNSQQLADIFLLRQQVFIIEQQCFYEDIDGYDQKAHHLMFYHGATLAAYLRYFEPGIKYAESSLGRIVVDKKYRGGSTGRELIRKGIDLALEKHGENNIRIEAQSALLSYYQHFGFKEEGVIYPVDGIDHIQMVLIP